MKRNKKKAPQPVKPECELAKTDIAAYLEALHFRRKALGGLDETDVWKKLKRLDAMYAAVSDNQRLQYEALLRERDGKLKEAAKLFRQYKELHEGGENDESEKKQE